MIPRFRLRPLFSGVFIALACSWIGCTETRFGGDLPHTPTKTHQFKRAEQISVTVPNHEALAICTNSAQWDGAGTAEAEADGAGSARVAVRTDGIGQGEGLVRLGHRFANETDQQTDLHCTISFDYEFALDEDPGLRLPDATVGLRLYARDDRGRWLRDLPIVELSTENGATQQRSQKRVSFTITLGPGHTADIFLAGRARVNVPPERATATNASASLAVSNMQIEVVSKPAPPVTEADDESA